MAKNNLIQLGRTLLAPTVRDCGQAVTGREEIMKEAALAAWLLTAGLGLYMFAIWLIEDDGSEERKSYRRLRAPVVFGHAGFAVTGLAVWLVYMYVNLSRLAWITILILLLVAILGAFMFTRWIPVHRMATRSPELPVRQEAGLGSRRAGAGAAGGLGGRPDGLLPGIEHLPAESNFPLPVVLLHGVLAVTTVTLVVITVILRH